MTLVMAWKDPAGVHLASDSRVSFGANNGEYCDVATKITRIRVRVLPPTEDGKTEEPPPDLDLHLGLAFLGGTVFSYSVREAFQAVVERLQYVPGHTDFSLERLCSILVRIMESFRPEVVDALGWNSVGQVVVAGWCPRTVEAKVYLVSIDPQSGKSSISEQLVGIGYACFGSGKSEADRLMGLNSTAPLMVLRKIARDPSMTSVGGNIQYGGVADGEQHFRSYGLQDFEVDESPKTIDIRYCLGPALMLRDRLEFQWDDFHPWITYKAPFQKSIDMLLKAGYGRPEEL